MLTNVEKRFNIQYKMMRKQLIKGTIKHSTAKKWLEEKSNDVKESIRYEIHLSKRIRRLLSTQSEYEQAELNFINLKDDDK